MNAHDYWIAHHMDDHGLPVKDRVEAAFNAGRVEQQAAAVEILNDYEQRLLKCCTPDSILRKTFIEGAEKLRAAFRDHDMIYSVTDVKKILDDVVEASKVPGQSGFRLTPYDVQKIVDTIKERL